MPKSLNWKSLHNVCRNSDEIRDRVVIKYNLFEHYDIDPDSKFKYTQLYETFENNISFKRTEFMSIVIEVMDENPQMAADIANDISALIDSTMNRMQKERALQALKIVEDEYNSLKSQMEVLEDSLSKIRNFGVIDYESQAEVYNQAYANAILSGNTGKASKLKEKIDILADYGGAYVSIRDFLLYETEQLSLLKAKLAEAKVDANQNLSHKYIVNKAYKSEKKAYPKRSLIVIFSTFAAFIMTFVILIILDNIKQLKKA